MIIIGVHFICVELYMNQTKLHLNTSTKIIKAKHLSTQQQWTLNIKQDINPTFKVVLKGWIFTCNLNVDMSVESQMCLRRKFQRVGAAVEKTLSLQVWCLVLSGGDRMLVSEE